MDRVLDGRWHGHVVQVAGHPVTLGVGPAEELECSRGLGADVDQLVAVINRTLLLRSLGDYDGHERLSTETRIHLSSGDAARLVAEIRPVLATLRVSARTQIRMSIDPLRGGWEQVAR